MIKSIKATSILILGVAIIATVIVMLTSKFLVLFPSESEDIASIS